MRGPWIDGADIILKGGTWYKVRGGTTVNKGGTSDESLVINQGGVFKKYIDAQEADYNIGYTQEAGILRVEDGIMSFDNTTGCEDILVTGGNIELLSNEITSKLIAPYILLTDATVLNYNYAQIQGDVDATLTQFLVSYHPDSGNASFTSELRITGDVSLTQCGISCSVKMSGTGNDVLYVEGSLHLSNITDMTVGVIEDQPPPMPDGTWAVVYATNGLSCDPDNIWWNLSVQEGYCTESSLIAANTD